MKKVYVLALAMLMVMMVGAVSFADQNPAGSVNFNVKWTVQPMIHFFFAYGNNFAHFVNGQEVASNLPFSDFVFDSRTPNFSQPLFGTEDIIEGEEIFAGIASNDWWVLQFNKPRLISDNDHYTTVPVYAKRSMYNFSTQNESETGWFAGNDRIQRDMGVYAIEWEMKVKFKNWHTRYGNYENVYTVTVTQF